MKRFFGQALGLSFVISCVGAVSSPALKPHEHLVTILATNDLHGGLESTKVKPLRGQPGHVRELGGMAVWAGIVESFREAYKKYKPTEGGLLLVDAGDQFQGKLISNFNEGDLIIGFMKAMGYDGIIPGNHDFDFGPKGWRVDQSLDHSKRREVLTSLQKKLGKKFLSANIFLRASNGVVADANCQVDAKNPNAKKWKAVRPDFVEPYRIPVVGGVKVALVGIDNEGTPGTTTEDNVDDLCFSPELGSYLSVAKELSALPEEKRPDVTVMIIHDGDVRSEHNATQLAKKILADASHPKLDAMVSGHTHQAYTDQVSLVPVIQSGSDGKLFGKIDLIWNDETKKVTAKGLGGIKMWHDTCDVAAKEFCSVVGGKVAYEGVPVVPNEDFDRLIKAERQTIDTKLDGNGLTAKTILGHADVDIDKERIFDSALAESFTDAFLVAANDYIKKHPVKGKPNVKIDLAFLNTGGLRHKVEQGDVDYETVFNVVPFNNHAVAIGPMSTEKVLDVLLSSAKTCGKYGAILQSGLRASYRRDCSHPEGEDKALDPKATLVAVETVDGKRLYPGKPEVASFNVVTLDFLTGGGEGAEGFKGVPEVSDLDVARDLIANFYKIPANHFKWTGKLDNRWVQDH